MYTQVDAYSSSKSDIPQPDWADDMDNFVRRTNLQQAMDRAEIVPDAPARPLRMALSAVRETLDERTRDWRASARAVEQTMRQLLSAEHTRGDALRDLDRAQGVVARTSADLTSALAGFDERDGGKDIHS